MAFYLYLKGIEEWEGLGMKSFSIVGISGYRKFGFKTP
ncbi:hypothetical protein MYAER_2778 [Microcystis aeruginosa NIES-2549]|uniref:Uncharacterized protein n=1 Tax=Microcystis aeruginosa NIES-2549 TaxID=1641812 RepID=A0A0F6RMB9_MICAE|nr:hypothetical protein MYAER_2778 [Microcystis aeruginosa NIES-2549]AOC53522.1 hypothetical protein amyaer_2813 [Microcystis aeruginosa NIES-2481]